MVPARQANKVINGLFFILFLPSLSNKKTEKKNKSDDNLLFSCKKVNLHDL